MALGDFLGFGSQRFRAGLDCVGPRAGLAEGCVFWWRFAVETFVVRASCRKRRQSRRTLHWAGRLCELGRYAMRLVVRGALRGRGRGWLGKKEILDGQQRVVAGLNGREKRAIGGDSRTKDLTQRTQRKARGHGEYWRKIPTLRDSAKDWPPARLLRHYESALDALGWANRCWMRFFAALRMTVKGE